MSPALGCCLHVALGSKSRLLTSLRPAKSDPPGYPCLPCICCSFCLECSSPLTPPPLRTWLVLFHPSGLFKCPLLRKLSLNRLIESRSLVSFCVFVSFKVLITICNAIETISLEIKITKNVPLHLLHSFFPSTWQRPRRGGGVTVTS